MISSSAPSQNPGIPGPPLLGQPNPLETDRLVWMLDDDKELCELVSRFMKAAHWQFQWFADVRDLEQALFSGSPDALILDLMMPGKSGLDVLQSLRAAGYRFPVLMLSAMGSPPDRVRGFEAGANDYLAKPFLCRELQLRLDELIGNRTLQSDSAGVYASSVAQNYRFADLRFNPEQRLLLANGQTHDLTRGEVALLVVFCQSGMGCLTRKTLLQATGSLVTEASSRTIDVRVSRLKRKLRELNGGQDVIETIRGRGYGLVCQPEILERWEDPGLV